MVMTPSPKAINSEFREKLCAVAACLGWAFCSTLLIMLNAHILREEDFNYPILLCSLGQGFSGLAAWILVKFGYYNKNVTFNISSYVRTILPIGVWSAGTLALGNAGYLFLSVSFIQMLKAGTPVVTLFVMIAFRIESARLDLMLSVGVITLGCCLASWGEIDFNLLGFTLIMLSELFEALKTVTTQMLLGTRFSGPMEGIYHICPATFLCLLAVFGVLEFPRIALEVALVMSKSQTGEDGKMPGKGVESLYLKPHLYLLAASLGLVVNLLTMEVIKRTNSLTFKIIGQ
eukprot:Ihof_evm3s126 gene=Ihof_evmTU3s126